MLSLCGMKDGPRKVCTHLTIAHACTSFALVMMHCTAHTHKYQCAVVMGSSIPFTDSSFHESFIKVYRVYESFDSFESVAHAHSNMEVLAQLTGISSHRLTRKEQPIVVCSYDVYKIKHQISSEKEQMLFPLMSKQYILLLIII